MMDSLAARQGGVSPRYLLYPKRMEEEEALPEDSALDVSHQMLTSFPAEHRLDPLRRRLLANSNLLEALVPTLRRFTSLQVLQLRDNRLRELQALGETSTLVELDVAGNLLQELPAALGRLRALTTLIVSRN